MFGLLGSWFQAMSVSLALLRLETAAAVVVVEVGEALLSVLLKLVVAVEVWEVLMHMFVVV